MRLLKPKEPHIIIVDEDGAEAFGVHQFWVNYIGDILARVAKYDPDVDLVDEGRTITWSVD